MSGPKFVIAQAQVLERSSYQGKNGLVYQCKVGGFAFNHTFSTQNSDEMASWPPTGAVVSIEADLMPGFDAGTFKLSNPVITVLKAVAGGTQRSAAGA